MKHAVWVVVCVGAIITSTMATTSPEVTLKGNTGKTILDYTAAGPDNLWVSAASDIQCKGAMGFPNPQSAITITGTLP